MKKIMFISILVGLFAVSAKLPAQLVSPKIPFILNLDYSRFDYDDQNGYLEVYYSFYPRHITYNHENGSFDGGIIVVTKLIDPATQKPVVNHHSLLNISEKDTSGVWYNFPLISRSSFVLKHGDYILDVLAMDSLQTSRRDSLKLNLQIQPPESGISSSDIELCKSITQSKNQNQLFYKNSLEVVPFPSLIFGSTTTPVMFHYVELYNLEPGKIYNVKTELLTSAGTSIRQVTRQKKFAAANSIEVGTTPVSPYRSGKYTIRISLLDEKQNEIFATDKLFFIYNPHVEMVMAEKEKKKFESMSEAELDQEFLYAKYLSSEQEKRIYSQLKTYKAKADFLFEFWKKVARGRGDFPPIERSSYLARVEKAKSKYRVMRKEGWESDQGRVFIIYSEPDEIERVPSEAGSKPYEIWRYFNIEGGVEFVFAKRTGSADALELVHSTKRGELRDENWQQYIH